MPHGLRPATAYAALCLLGREGLVEGDVLVVSRRSHDWARPHGLGGDLGLRVVCAGLDELDGIARTFRTVIDAAGMDGLSGPQRRTRARRLADLVEPSCFLHVVWPSRRPGAGRPGGATVPADDIAASFRVGWTLLGVRCLAGGVREARSAWVASFVRAPARGRPRSAVRNFTDLGAFGSLDLGAATDRPPWGT